MNFLFLTALVKSFPHHDVRKRREFLAFSHDLVSQQKLCSGIAGCRDAPITLAQGRSRTQLHPQRPCILQEQASWSCLPSLSLILPLCELTLAKQSRSQ